MGGNATQVVAEIRDGVMVVLENIGEGICGEYDPANSEDTPLLRFTVYSGEPGTDPSQWGQVEDASYCTNISANTPVNQVRRLASMILDRVHSPASRGESIRRLCAELSWIDDSWATTEFA